MSDPDPISQFFTDSEVENDTDSTLLYTALSLTKASSPPPTADEIKKAYRRAALKWHPDKHASASDEDKEKARLEFMKVGFAYEVLSDEGRRKTYDRTGSTATAGLFGAAADAEAAGGWEAYFKSMWTKVDKSVLDEDKKAYQGSPSELSDLHSTYLLHHGSLPHILASIPHSSSTADEPRFIALLSGAITSGALPSFPEWEKSSKDERARKERLKEEKGEEKEAEEMARELGVWEEFYGGGKGGASASGSGSKGESSTSGGKKRKADSTSASTTNGKGKKSKRGDDEEGDISALAAIIARRQASREDQLDAMLRKYTAIDKKEAKSKASKGSKSKKGKKGKKDPDDESDEEEGDGDEVDVDDDEMKKMQASMPTDEEFEALQAKIFGKENDKAGSSSNGGGKAKGKKEKAGGSKKK